MASQLRETNLDRLDEGEFDVCIVGAGINGAVAAAALAARGIQVALIDKGDFAGQTSSQSSNLAWGGVKYLESLEFPLVWNLCKSRNDLMDSYPSTVKEIRFLTTIREGFRMPSFFVYLGTLLYWVMGRFRTKPPAYLSVRGLRRRESKINAHGAAGGIVYSDCYLHDNDARFVYNFVRDALDYGAAVANYVSADTAARRDGRWTVDATDRESGRKIRLSASVLVNACGPSVDAFNQVCGQVTETRHLFSKGVHLMVDRITDAKHILAFFASDGRLFFVIPMGPKTCIGTTDTPVDDPDVRVSDEDRRFILDNVNELLDLDEPLTTDDVIAERCGVRPLAVSGDSVEGDWIALSRKHVVETDPEHGHISIFGGKLTDCINVGDEIVDEVAALGVDVGEARERWYGEPDKATRDEFFRQAELIGLESMADPRVCEPLSDRLWRRYERGAFEMLEAIRRDPRNAERMIDSAEYLRCEIKQAARREMITRLDDFLRRRSKISLVVPEEDYIDSAGLVEVCEVLFGSDAERKLAEYKAGLEKEGASTGSAAVLSS